MKARAYELSTKDTRSHLARSSVPSHTAEIPEGLRAASLRDYNLSLLTYTVLTSPIPISRAQLSKLTGLNRSTVTRLTDFLIDSGMLSEEETVIKGAGRPSIPLSPAHRTHTAIGLALDKGTINIQVVDLSGEPIAEKYFEHSDDDFRSIIDTAKRLTSEVVKQIERAGLNLIGIAIALPGLVNTNSGILVSAPSLSWPQTDVFAEFRDLQSTQPTPLALLNDASAASIGEHYARQKSGIPSQNFIYIGGHSGIGAALVHDGRIQLGDQQWGGELGHIFVSDSGHQCECGRLGCLSAYVSRSQMLQLAGLNDRYSDGHLHAALARKERKATAALRQAGTYLGRAVATYINLVDSPEVVIGGFLRPLFPYFRKTMFEELERSCLRQPFAPVTVAPSLVKNNASAFGAAWATINKFIEDSGTWKPVSKGLLNFKSASTTPTVYIDED